ncbi:hypothetical protein BG011_010191 [Mortierella polycephala]|uniref:Uncharacterized protein n=1 Tax=Mortierella polycephala TaxID=41804 RepID=A0A9P6Q8Q1_9FUNG|nr:hypothetical protein BG011_010191 [Mortierella polycephala]
MKFSTTIFGMLSTLAFLPFMLSSAQACERDCQVNVSHAFSDKYQQLTADYFKLLSRKADESLFYGIPVKTILNPEDTTKAIQSVQDSVTSAQSAWDVTIAQTIYDTIFNDEPRFKGDCKAPLRVTQPPVGVSWTMVDCHLQDYICGNPPSICHFLPMIRARIVKKLSDQLQLRMDGDDSDVYANFLAPALHKLLTQQPKLEQYTARLHGNLNQILEDVKDRIASSFEAEEQWRHEWDMDIRTLLLTFP